MRSQSHSHSGTVNMYIAVLTLLMPTALSACYWNDRRSYDYFGSITPYGDVRGDLRDVTVLNGCEPISIWFIGRHGVRHPGKDDMDNMKKMTTIKEDVITSHAQGRGELCAQDISNLQKWTWNYSMDSATSALTAAGYQELFELGTRFHEKFHSLLENLDEYEIRPSLEQRTQMSAKAFVEGLGMDIWSFNVSEAMEKDDVIRPYKFCNTRTDEIINGPQIQNEMNKYYKSEEFQQELAYQIEKPPDGKWLLSPKYTGHTKGVKIPGKRQMLKNIEKRTGIKRALTPQNATGLYDLCRFYRALSETRKDPWCSLFSNQDLEIMEYIGDVRHYYRNGYGGGSTNVKLGEVTLKNLFEKFQLNNNSRSITGYFSHDTMIEMVYSALGLYKDYPEISGFERVKNRLWRSSFIAPFAANFVAVLNRCNNKDDESLKIQFFINEVELRLCKERACSWEDFNEKFSRYANSNLNFCQNTKL